MKEAVYRRRFQRFLEQETCGWVYHPPESMFSRDKIPDIFFSPIKPALIEVKVHRVKSRPWTVDEWMHDRPQQYQFYQDCVNKGFDVYVVIYSPYMKKSDPPRIWSFCANRFVDLDEFLRAVKKECPTITLMQQ